MRRVFITGSSGLIGSWVGARFIREGWHVTGLDIHKPQIPSTVSCFIEGNILDSDQLSNAMSKSVPDCVLHLAARVDLDGQYIDDYAENTIGVENVCHAVNQMRTVKRAIYTSSQLVCRVGYVPSFDTDYCPHTTYGESKVKTEEIVRDLKGGGTSWCIGRPTTVWGPHMSDHYTSLIRHIEKGQYFHAGSEALYKSYVYAENIAHQYWALAQAPSTVVDGNVYYLADYQPLSLRAYINDIAAHLEVKRPITLPLPVARCIAFGGDILNGIGLRFPYSSFRLNNIRTEYVFDLRNIQEIAGDLPKTYSDGVRETVQWYLDGSSPICM